MCNHFFLSHILSPMRKTQLLIHNYTVLWHNNLIIQRNEKKLVCARAHICDISLHICIYIYICTYSQKLLSVPTNCNTAHIHIGGAFLHTKKNSKILDIVGLTAHIMVDDRRTRGSEGPLYASCVYVMFVCVCVCILR